MDNFKQFSCSERTASAVSDASMVPLSAKIVMAAMMWPLRLNTGHERPTIPGATVESLRAYPFSLISRISFLNASASFRSSSNSRLIKFSVSSFRIKAANTFPEDDFVTPTCDPTLMPMLMGRLLSMQRTKNGPFIPHSDKYTVS
nr:hypothetical protein [Paenibacillus sp. UNC496MF]